MKETDDMTTTRERRAAKAERLRGWADGRDEKADAAYAGVKGITDRIPLGQPILVGHHSERGARADQRRIERGLDAFCEHTGKAAEMRQRAANIEAQDAGRIYADDEDAVERLEAKIAGLERRQQQMKDANAAYRKAHKVELKAMTAYERSIAVPFPGYALTNLGATLRTARKRLEEVKREQVEGPAFRRITAKYAGDCCECGATIERGQTVLYARAAGVKCEGC